MSSSPCSDYVSHSNSTTDQTRLSALTSARSHGLTNTHLHRLKTSSLRHAALAAYRTKELDRFRVKKRVHSAAANDSPVPQIDRTTFCFLHRCTSTLSPSKCIFSASCICWREATSQRRGRVWFLVPIALSVLVPVAADCS